MKDPAEIEYIKVLDDFFWSAYNTGVAIGSIENENAFSYETLDDFPGYIDKNAIFSVLDTGSSAINFSSLYFNDFIAKLFAYMEVNTWQVEDGIIFTKCSHNFPDLFFLFNNKWIRVHANDYVQPLRDSDGLCYLQIVPINAPMHVIGMPLFMDYYTVHDMDQGTIGFVPHSTSAKG